MYCTGVTGRGIVRDGANKWAETERGQNRPEQEPRVGRERARDRVHVACARERVREGG